MASTKAHVGPRRTAGLRRAHVLLDLRMGSVVLTEDSVMSSITAQDKAGILLLSCLAPHALRTNRICAGGSGKRAVSYCASKLTRLMLLLERRYLEMYHDDLSFSWASLCRTFAAVCHGAVLVLDFTRAAPGGPSSASLAAPARYLRCKIFECHYRGFQQNCR